MIIIAESVNGNEFEIIDITEINFTQTASVACDSLSVKYKSDNVPDEITSIKAYDRGELIFFGYCDNQRISEDKNGYEIFFYARSSACLLVDNEAQPYTYNMPTANQLWFTFARPLGFSYGLPSISSNNKYEVTKSTSCYGAISRFVSMTTGKYIRVSPNNRISLLEKSDDIKDLGLRDVISAEAVINRSEPVTRIRFKKNSYDPGYKMNMEAAAQSQYMLIPREKYVNLSSLPAWQREYSVYQTLKQSYEDYKILNITVKGFLREPLYQRFSYYSALGNYEDYVLSEKEYILDGSGEITKLTLKKEIDIKEITYVD